MKKKKKEKGERKGKRKKEKKGKEEKILVSSSFYLVRAISATMENTIVRQAEKGRKRKERRRRGREKKKERKEEGKEKKRKGRRREGKKRAASRASAVVITVAVDASKQVRMDDRSTYYSLLFNHHLTLSLVCCIVLSGDGRVDPSEARSVAWSATRASRCGCCCSNCGWQPKHCMCGSDILLDPSPQSYEMQPGLSVG